VEFKISFLEYFLKKDKYLKITGLYDIFCCIKADCLYMVTYINNEEENL